MGVGRYAQELLLVLNLVASIEQLLLKNFECLSEVSKHEACLLQYGEVTAKLLALYSVARLASMSGARKIASQGSQSGSRSFNYDSSGTEHLLTQIRAWDKNNCLSDLPLSGKKTGFFAVVGGA